MTKACDLLGCPKLLKDSMPEGLAGQFWLRICHRLQSSYQLGCCQMACLGGQDLLATLSCGWGGVSEYFPDYPVAGAGVGGVPLRGVCPQSCSGQGFPRARGERAEREERPQMEGTVSLSLHI